MVTAFGLAATVALAILATTTMFEPDGSPLEPVAVVVKHSGNILTSDTPEIAGRPAGPTSATLFTGQQIETGKASFMALRWSAGESIRMDEHTTLMFLSTTEIELLSGRIYIDSGASPPHKGTPSSLITRTIAGEIRHLGTQYMAELSPAGVTVIVREGRVMVAASGNESIANSGEQLNVTVSGQASVQPVSTFGQIWAWTESAAPTFELDGKTIHDFLVQVARETGRTLVFQNAAAEHLARTSTLNGRMDLAPMRALDLVLQTTDLAAVTENGNIVVHAR